MARVKDQTGERNPNWKGGIEDQAAYRKAYRARNPEKHKAQSKIDWAIRSGKLERGECEVCGKPDAHAHHDDYSKPYDIRWLCRQCHVNFHYR